MKKWKLVSREETEEETFYQFINAIDTHIFCLRNALDETKDLVEREKIKIRIFEAEMQLYELGDEANDFLN